MGDLIIWYFTLTLLGLVTFPLTFWLFPGLSDRGYAFSRTLGLLLWAYVFWLLTSLGVLRNEPGGLIFALMVLLVLSFWAATRVGADAFYDWWDRQRGSVLVVELLFLAAFGLMAFLRGHNPDLASTEKPMELMFINSILRSPTFPPHDSWLAGYAISYYYFGYVMTAMLAMLTNTSTPVAFSLMLATVFALGALGAWGVVFNLLEKGRGEREEAMERGSEEAKGRGSENGIRDTEDGILTPQHGLSNALFALLAPLFVLIVSNVEGFLDVLHARGIGWSENGFWQWLNLKDLSNVPQGADGLLPQRFLWWWRASRVVNDVNFSGGEIEVIDEFPFFSFLLGDLHPHVLAIPFAFLAMGLALNMFFNRETEEINLFGFRLHLGKITFGLGALALGGLAFLNTWDFPIYLALFVGTYVVKRASEDGWSWNRLGDFAGLGAALGVTGIVLYLPFYVGFSSQAGGILPNLLNPTRGAHLWVMFGTLLVPVLAYLLSTWQTEGGQTKTGFALSGGLMLFLFVFSLGFAGLAALTPEGANAINLLGAPDAGAFLQEALRRRLMGFGGWLTLLVLLGLTVADLVRKDDAGEETPARAGSGSRTFALLMIGIGTLLVIGPEFVYLRDQFGTRMNTVFKFYYQAWLLWGVAAAFGASMLLKVLQGAGRGVFAAVLLATIGMGLFYPLLSVRTRTNDFQQAWTLDGTVNSYLSGDDVAAVAWLKTAPLGTLVEASDVRTYSGFSRISGHSGMPTVLGWPGHEAQWRGGYEEQGSRLGDVETIYRSGSWAETQTLLDRYGVRYVYVGPLERSTYPVNEAKFRRFLRTVYEQGGVLIFEYDGESNR